MIVKKLSELSEGQKGVVTSVDGDLFIKRRLLELGLVNGTSIQVLSISPLKNTFLINLHDYTLALRKNSLNLVSVEVYDK